MIEGFQTSTIGLIAVQHNSLHENKQTNNNKNMHELIKMYAFNVM